jgi:hypothetical protein
LPTSGSLAATASSGDVRVEGCAERKDGAGCTFFGKGKGGESLKRWGERDDKMKR